jgi:D-alanine-D-alanine ligase
VNDSDNKKLILIIYDISSDKTAPGEMESELLPEANQSRAAYVRNALKEAGFNVKTLGLRSVNSKVIARIEEIDPAAIFNLCESLYGDSRNEMYIAGLCELLKIPYTGSPPLALGIALNKRKSKQILRAANLPVPSSVLAIQGQSFSLSDLEAPYIIKPVREDGSTGISEKSVVKTKEEVQERIQFIHENYHQPALIEEFIPGRELNVSIMGGTEPQVLAIGEIDFSKMPRGEFHIVSYKAKWDEKSLFYEGTEPIYPAKLEDDLREKIEKVAIKAYKEIGCRDFGRIDMRLKDDGKFYILEVNSNPDISPDAGFTRAASIAGFNYSQILGKIVEMCLERSTKKARKELSLQSVI